MYIRGIERNTHLKFTIMATVKNLKKTKTGDHEFNNGQYCLGIDKLVSGQYSISGFVKSGNKYRTFETMTCTTFKDVKNQLSKL